jgi:hypothetical protein
MQAGAALPSLDHTANGVMQECMDRSISQSFGRGHGTMDGAEHEEAVDEEEDMDEEDDVGRMLRGGGGRRCM